MKRVLLDTHAFIWWIGGNESLGPVTRALISDTANQIYISAATVWEMSIKRQLGKLSAPDDLEAIVERSGFTPLPAQAQAEGLSLVTEDAAFPAYGVRLLSAGD